MFNFTRFSTLKKRQKKHQNYLANGNKIVVRQLNSKLKIELTRRGIQYSHGSVTSFILSFLVIKQLVLLLHDFSCLISSSYSWLYLIEHFYVYIYLFSAFFCRFLPRMALGTRNYATHRGKLLVGSRKLPRLWNTPQKLSHKNSEPVGDIVQRTLIFLGRGGTQNFYPSFTIQRGRPFGQ